MTNDEEPAHNDTNDTGFEKVTINNAGKREKPLGREIVTIDEMVKKENVRASEVGPLTRIGYKLATWLLIYLSAVTLFLLIYLWYSSPAPPKGLSLCEAQLNQYNQLSAAALDRTIKLLDTLVLKGFLPVLTAVLGYIFGTRGADREAS